MAGRLIHLGRFRKETLIRDNETPVVTKHASERCSQRNIPFHIVKRVMEFGRREYAGGAIYHFFGKKEAKKHQPILGKDVEKLEGIVVLVSHENSVITTFRNHNGPKYIKKLRKRAA